MSKKSGLSEPEEINRHLEWLATRIKDPRVRRQILVCSENIRGIATLDSGLRNVKPGVHPAYERAC